MFNKFSELVKDESLFQKANDIVKEGFNYHGEIVEIYGEDYYRIFASFKERKHSVSAVLIVNYENVFRFNCQCDTHYYRTHYCEHFLCLLAAADAYAKNHRITRTNKRLLGLMSRYVPKLEENNVNNKTIHLQPELELNNNGELSVSYRIGENKFYVLKNISDFVNRIKEKEVYSYGKNFVYDHDKNKLDDISLKNYDIMESYVEVVANVNQFLENKYYNYGNIDVKRSMPLSGKLLDQFFEVNIGQNIGMRLSKSFEPAMIDIKQNESIYEIQFPKYYFIRGNEFGYIYYKDTLYQVDASYNQYEDIVNTFYNEGGQMICDEDDMKHLYSSLVPVLKNKFEISANFDETSFEPLKANFTFMLDSIEDDITLDYTLSYGEKHYRINVYEDADIRNLALETKVDELIHHYFNESEDYTYHIKGDEELFELISVGIDEFNRYGEVFASSKFKKLSVFKSPNINIGVSLSNNLLNFDIDIEGIDLQEVNDILNSYRLKKKYHRLKSGEFLMIDESKFEALNEIVGKSKKDLKALAEGNLNIPMYRSLYLDKLLEESDNIQYDPDYAFKQLIHDFDSIKTNQVSIPENLNGELRNYQKEGYEWLSKLHHYHFGGILADDMGLGKTLQMITLLLKVKGTSPYPSIIVTPASLVYNWESEIKKFAPTLTTLLMTGTQKERIQNLESYEFYDVLITSYDLLKRDITYYEGKKFNIEVIDEAQFIKNPQTLQSKAVKAIEAQTKFALSGTPIENKLSELWSIFEYLMPGFLYNYQQFRNEFENKIVKEEDQASLTRLQKMIGPFILRRSKKDVLKDLPDKIDKVMYAAMESKQKNLYESYVKRIKASLSSQTEQEFKDNKIMVLQELTRLRQLCCDPNLFLDNFNGESCKLQQCLDLVDSAIEGEHKILLFSQFKSMLDIIGNELTKKGIRYYMISGETPKEKRYEQVNLFNHDDTPVFLISLKAGGTGLNLTAADIVIHYDPWWNEAAMNQATDRAHRIGQKNVVTVYKMIVKDTIEEEIMKLQESKSQLASSILEGSSTSLSSLSKDDLLDILR